MAQFPTPFNPLAFNPAQGGGMLPVGRLPVVIESSELKATAANDGGFLVLNLRVIQGEHEGATGVYRLNLFNANEKAKEIAARQLSAVCHVVGHLNPLSDSAELHNRPFVVEVQHQRGEEAKEKGYTEVKRVFDMQGNEPGKQNINPQNAAISQPQTPASAPLFGTFGGQVATSPFGQAAAPQQQPQPSPSPFGQAPAQAAPASPFGTFGGQPSAPWGPK